MVHWKTLVIVALVVGLSGCISAVDPGNETASEEDAEPAPQPITRSGYQESTCQVPAATVGVGEQPVCDEETVEVPDGTFEIEFEIEWNNEANDYALQIDTPSGERKTATSDNDEDDGFSYELDDPESGTYTYFATAQSVAFADEVKVSVNFFWLEVAGEPGAYEPPIKIEQQNGRYKATIVYLADGDTDEFVNADIDTINGDIELQTIDAGETELEVEAYAWANTEDRARELVLSIDVDLAVQPDELFADVTHQTNDLGDGEGLGADVFVETPAIVSGDVDTTNGDITLEAFVTDGIDVGTTNGDVSGEIVAADDVSLDTTNGEFDIILVPTESLVLDVDGTNGDVRLRLTERDDIGYRIDADNTNGEIREDMDDAELSGDEHDATLETNGYEGRDIQVSGSVDTTNGRIEFDGI